MADAKKCDRCGKLFEPYNYNIDEEYKELTGISSNKRPKKQKVKVEDYLKTELSSIAEKVFEKKQEKKKLMEQITQLLFDINNIKQETKKVIDTNTFEVKKLKDDISLGTLKSNDLFARSIKKKEKHAKNAEVKFHLQQQTAEKSDKRITN